jgi:F0F1-type ATP synthase membrane subunit c/vacuolar-type H+-ATPase subunit K
MKREYQAPSTALPDLRRKLFTIAAAFVAAQLSYCFVGYFVISSVRDSTPREADHMILVMALMFVAVSALTASFVVVTTIAQQTASVAPQQSLSKQLIIGSAMSEAPALIGLALFFLGSQLVVLVVLAGMSAAAIVAHYLRVSSKLEKLQHGSPR